MIRNMDFLFKKNRSVDVIAALLVFIFLSHCSGTPVYLVPKESSDEMKGKGERVDVKIRPIFTSDFGSEDRDKYPVDFSSYFTAIEIHIHNGTANEVRWNSSQSVLKFGERSEFKVLNEDEAFHYYKYGGLEENGVVLLEKPYERQKEDIENIKRFLMKSVSIPVGGDASGLLLFKKIPPGECENVNLIVSGIEVNLEEKGVAFPLECPKE